MKITECKEGKDEKEINYSRETLNPRFFACCQRLQDVYVLASKIKFKNLVQTSIAQRVAVHKL